MTATLTAAPLTAPRIHQLDPGVVNKIAAGEVIERPASVLKELLENSVDALATRIDVEIEAGGAELIRVVDDGEGIHPDDVPLAIASHATSKLHDADDLFRVRTMGFRGEALASIAEVSRFRLRTRQSDQLTGTELVVESGEVKPPQPCGCPAGTSIEIRQLFINTPVRRKFLKRPATEFGHISEQFTRVALAQPRLHMRLVHNGKTVYDLPGTDRLLERLECFYGSELAENLLWVEQEQGDLRLWGYVAHPKQSKSSRKGQHLFLNGRWIQDRSLQHALTESYRGLLMVGRQPISFLFLEVPADEVDVNVHPTKSEVRFRDSQQLYRLLLSTLRTKFLGMNLDAMGSQLNVGSSTTANDAGDPSNPSIDPARQAEVQQELARWAKQQLNNWQPTEDVGDPPDIRIIERDDLFTEQRQAEQRQAEQRQAEQRQAEDAPVDSSFRNEPPQSPAPVISTDTDTGDRPTSAASSARAMQVHDCYLVVETSAGLTVIDQHALHERIMYEHLRERVLAGTVEIQRLLIPVTIELSPKEAALIVDHIELLAELGLQIEEFGGSTVALTGYPTLLAKADPTELIQGIVTQIEEAGRAVTRRDLLDKLLHMMSCKAAIKAGQRLTFEEIASLLQQRHLVDDAHHCPHGRPTALTLSRNELDRQFGRLG